MHLYTYYVCMCSFDWTQWYQRERICPTFWITRTRVRSSGQARHTARCSSLEFIHRQHPCSGVGCSMKRQEHRCAEVHDPTQTNQHNKSVAISSWSQVMVGGWQRQKFFAVHRPEAEQIGSWGITDRGWWVLLRWFRSKRVSERVPAEVGAPCF